MKPSDYETDGRVIRDSERSEPTERTERFGRLRR
jgi:hypothetical protein